MTGRRFRARLRLDRGHGHGGVEDPHIRAQIGRTLRAMRQTLQLLTDEAGSLRKSLEGAARVRVESADGFAGLRALLRRAATPHLGRRDELIDRGESFYNELMDEVVRRLEKKRLSGADPAIRECWSS